MGIVGLHAEPYLHDVFTVATLLQVGQKRLAHYRRTSYNISHVHNVHVNFRQPLLLSLESNHVSKCTVFFIVVLRKCVLCM